MSVSLITTVTLSQMTMDSDIQRSLSVLVGLPLWALGRAADLAWFEFGDRRTVLSHLGKEKLVGDYALHIQCPWRMTLGHEIITGRGDIFCAPEKSEEPTPIDFDWQKGNRFDRIVAVLFDHESRQLTVQGVRAGEVGSLVIQLEDGYKLEVFPYDFESGEHWRFSSHTLTSHTLYLAVPGCRLSERCRLATRVRYIKIPLSPAIAPSIRPSSFTVL
jgi:hypothetical protein